MKRFSSATTALLLCLISGSLASPIKGIAHLAVSHFAVAELFTSEGCSSCPAADHVFARLRNEMEGLPVYFLSYHVDYWDRLGWKDRFSDHKYAVRQNEYSEKMKLNSVYTPQVVIDGTAEFVGSMEGKFRSQIAKELKENRTNSASITSIELTRLGLVVHYSFSFEGPGMQAVATLVQHSAQSSVRAGENAGQILEHTNVVRLLSVQPLQESGKGMLPLNGTIDLKAGMEVVLLLQDVQTGRITAADKKII